ncbi:efflux transporter outer membrane subunit [Qipengyuania aestuarii]|uniref:efflux transporter outer membrane subunit n=1 Tax=Qipengyuania aestuarii TaxID=2867241 RepID=UPI001FFDBD58|nr:efflux transporter outer membrane subunit [Qipengyuania aestuarii]
MFNSTGRLRAVTRAALPMAAAVGLGACATPLVTAPQPEVAVPPAWATVETGTAPAPELAQYWTLLDDPLLTDLVEQAIAENRDLAIGIARLDQARAGLRGARAGYLPTVNGSAGARRDVGDLADDDVRFSLGADAAWEVDLFGRISNNVAASRADLAAAGYSLADIQRLIVGQVASQAITARALSQQLAIARSSLAFQDDNLQLARWRNQAGLVSSLDVEQARTQRAQTAATIPLLESNLAATANAISTLIGEPPGRVLAAFEASEPVPVPRPPILTAFAAPAEVLARRPDVRAAEADVVASAARIGVARADLLPALRLTGSIGAGASPLADIFDLVTGNLFAGLTQLIFDGGRTAARVDSAAAAARASLASYEQAILRALEEVESSATDQRSADERVAITEEAVDAAQNSAFLARNQYEAGLTDFQTLLVIESQLLSARNQLVGAEADRATAFVRLTQALGGGWSDLDYTLPIPGPAAGQDDRTAQ